jgi:hypothetical protein
MAGAIEFALSSPETIVDAPAPAVADMKVWEFISGKSANTALRTEIASG